MTMMDLERAAAEAGYELVPLGMRDDLFDAVLEAEALRCDLELLVTITTEDALTRLTS